MRGVECKYLAGRRFQEEPVPKGRWEVKETQAGQSKGATVGTWSTDPHGILWETAGSRHPRVLPLERREGWYLSRTPWGLPGGRCFCLPSAKAGWAPTTRGSPWHWGSWALCSKAGVWAPPGPCLRAREPGKVSDFIPPPGKHGVVKRGFP